MRKVPRILKSVALICHDDRSGPPLFLGEVAPIAPQISSVDPAAASARLVKRDPPSGPSLDVIVVHDDIFDDLEATHTLDVTKTYGAVD
ncbi:hypothetical protein BGZ97_001125 [Linnemannia gamsii]|uniref:Uncharacterized protein n=1 Tax=Linnemannia gamsii TaxID=64522 RepID=A0A9P6UUJ8_9FUNG|nr:hypothetical protein BGZ97_001125 [Linnemannia gamsii]